MSFTYNPNKRKRAKTHGFRKRMATTSGRNVLKRRRLRGRKKLCVWSVLVGRSQNPGRSTLRAHSEFQRVFKEGTRLFRNGLGFCVRKAEGVPFKYGVSLPRRFGCAVERNKVRRRLREIVRTAVSLPESAEIVFCVNRPCSVLSYDVLKSACEWAFKKVSQLKTTIEATARWIQGAVWMREHLKVTVLFLLSSDWSLFCFTRNSFPHCLGPVAGSGHPAHTTLMKQLSAMVCWKAVPWEPGESVVVILFVRAEMIRFASYI